MKRSTRWFGLLSVAFLATSPSTRADEKVEAFFPKDTDFIMSLNIEQILSSDVVKKYALDKVKAALTSNDQVKQVLGAFGLDPLTDFTRIYASGQFNFNEQKSFMVVEGKFDPKKIAASTEEFLKNSGDFQAEKISGKTAYKFTPPNSPAPIYGMVVDTKYIVLGSDKEYLEGAAAAIGGKGKSALDKDMAALLGKADPKASMFMVANTKEKLAKLPIPGGNTQVLDAIEFFAVELKIEKDVKLNVALGVANEDMAQQMGMQIKQMLNLGKAFIPQMIPQGDPRQKPVVDVVSGIKTTQKGKVITLSAEATDSIIEALLKADR
jgi:hypothetical protein